MCDWIKWEYIEDVGKLRGMGKGQVAINEEWMNFFIEKEKKKMTLLKVNKAHLHSLSKLFFSFPQIEFHVLSLKFGKFGSWDVEGKIRSSSILVTYHAFGFIALQFKLHFFFLNMSAFLIYHHQTLMLYVYDFSFLIWCVFKRIRRWVLNSGC